MWLKNAFAPIADNKILKQKKSFFSFLYHFFEDLTHYEGIFWKTIKNLLFNPASLTIEYLSGKKMSFLAPIRLYLFVSFLTFLPFSLSKTNNKDFITVTKKNETLEPKLGTIENKIINFEKEGRLSKNEKDSILKYLIEKMRELLTFNSLIENILL